MEKDSIPENNEGDQQDHSLQQDSADNVDTSQPSNDDAPQFFEDENQEEQDDSNDAPSQTTQTDDDTSDESQEESNEVEPELAKWAESQNIELDSPTAIKLAKRLRDTQKGLHEKSAELKQKYDQAANEAAGGDQVSADSAKLARMEFMFNNPEAKELEGAMYDIALKAKDEGDIAGFQYYQTPRGWETLLKIAKAEQAQNLGDQSYVNGRKDERKNLAKKQQASGARPNAQNTTPESASLLDKVDKMSQAEYEKFRRENPDFNPFQG